MIDAHGGFTGSTGTAVTLKLVTGGTLLPSILSGKGPDVYIGLGSADVINYAIREAVIGVSGNDKHLSAADNAVFLNTYYTFKDEANDKFYTISPADFSSEAEFQKKFNEYSEKYTLTFTSEDFETNVSGNYVPAAMDTVTLLDVSYGIPQTMSFAMMFYRMDVLADLGLRVPETWQELLKILPVLQTNNMSIGVSYIDALDFMIYQTGGSMWKYTDDSLYDSKYAGARIDLDSNIALETFDFTCRLYSDYSFPVSYDASNRFRTGEMPIIIGGYSGIYNTLTVYATEIEGLWEFCSLPGSKRADGTFNYDSLAGIGASVILYGCEGDELLASWQFLQWQTGEKAQAEYGNRMVALIGPSAKYETANLKAIDNLSWTASEKAAIMNQMDHMSSIVNYPGSYIINRYTQFAFLEAVNESADPIDALSGYIDAINSEIARKREEFGLWVPESSDDEPPQLETAE
jgi:ABC-type glycerol-3-phosphate transport system substrate-binding protein